MYTLSEYYSFLLYIYGMSMDQVYAVADRFNNNMASLAVALRTATHPSTGQSIFELADDEMYLMVPGKDIVGIVEALPLIVDANAQLSDYHRERGRQLTVS